MVDLRRRMLLGGLMLLALGVATVPARADGGEDGGGDGGGDDNGGDDNGGSGGGGDDNDDDSDDDNGGSGGGVVNAGPGPGTGKTKVEDQYRAEKAVKNGKAVSLQKLKSHLDRKYPGKLLSVALARRQGNYIYKLRILSPSNRIQAVSLNALTLEAVVY